MKIRLIVIPLLVLTSLILGACADGVGPAGNMQNRDGLAASDVEAAGGNASRYMQDQIEITGVISMISDGSMTIAGQSFLLTTDTETQGALEVGDLAKVHALLGKDGEVYAREIAPADAALSSVGLQDGSQRNGQNFELVGVVDSMGETTWTISRHNIVVNAQTEINGDFSAGTLVRVQASADESQGLVAQIIEVAQGNVSADSGKTVDDDLKVKGYVESITDEFVIVDGETYFFSDLTEMKVEISVGDYVEVYFFEQDGQKVALEIELEDMNDDGPGGSEDDDDSELKVKGYVESITDEFVIIDGTTFFFSELTEMKDEISVGDYVEVYFFEQDGQKVALEIELDDLNVGQSGELDDDDDKEDDDDSDRDDDDDRETEHDDHHNENNHEAGDDD